jgi:apolipoprotein N-acyltransferase
MVNSFNFFVRNFNKDIVIYGFVTALFFSAFIYLEHFDLTNKLINSISAVAAIYMIFKADRPRLFVTGFFVGVLWFYWIPFSMRFYDLHYLIPFAILGLGLLYAFIFLLFGIIERPFFKIIALYFVQYLEPFDFNWFKPQLMFVNSYFGIENFHFDFLMVSIAIMVMMRGWVRLLAIPLFVFAFDYTNYNYQSDTKIYLADPQLDQSRKWQRSERKAIFDDNFRLINEAIAQGYEIVVLPEAAFPTVLNRAPKTIEKLKELSYQIGIVTGGLNSENGGYYNSTYIIEDGSMRIINKHILVPFGEYIPLPGVLRDWINETFYNGAKDYKRAQTPKNFMLKDGLYRNAICYEATSEALFENSPGYMIATSNNSWFTPSIEPTLQHLLLKLYAKRYKTIIYHSANMGGTGIIYP